MQNLPSILSPDLGLLFWMLLACFKTNNEIFGSLKLLPSSWSFEAFAKGWETTGTFTYARYFSNTFLKKIPDKIAIARTFKALSELSEPEAALCYENLSNKKIDQL